MTSQKIFLFFPFFPKGSERNRFFPATDKLIRTRKKSEMISRRRAEMACIFQFTSSPNEPVVGACSFDQRFLHCSLFIAKNGPLSNHLEPQKLHTTTESFRTGRMFFG